MSLISVRKTPSYSPGLLREAVDFHFAALGVEKDLRPGMKVLLKPNLLAAPGALTTRSASEASTPPAKWIPSPG